MLVGIRQCRDDQIDRTGANLLEFGDRLLSFRTHQVVGRLDLCDQSVRTQVAEKTHSAVLMLSAWAAQIAARCPQFLKWPGRSKQAGIMPCLPEAPAVLTSFRVSFHVEYR